MIFKINDTSLLQCVIIFELKSTVMWYHVLHYTIWCPKVLYHTILHYTIILYCTILLFYNTWHLRWHCWSILYCALLLWLWFWLWFSGGEDMQGIVPRACEEILKAMEKRRGKEEKNRLPHNYAIKGAVGHYKGLSLPFFLPSLLP